MEFIRANKNDLTKVIIVIEKTGTGYTKKIYNSILEMSPEERDAYIAQAFTNATLRSNPEELWTRQRLESIINAKLAKISKRK